jgi:mRNA interferase RelE/StbE
LSNGAGWLFTARARRDLKRLDPPVQRRIVDALDRLTGEPPAGDVVKLAGSDDEWRLRVGDWRVRFQRDPETGVVYVLRVLPRGRAYRD